MTTCYQLIDVQIGNQQTQARPVAWDREIWDGNGNDKNGEPVKPTEFNTTCPFCANLIHFNVDELYIAVDGSSNNVGCYTCKVANQKSEIASEEKETTVVASRTTFRDPIAEGLFGDEIDFEKLKKIDLTKSSKAV